MTQAACTNQRISLTLADFQRLVRGELVTQGRLQVALQDVGFGLMFNALADHLLPGPYIVSSRILAAKNISNRQWYQPETKRVLNSSKPSPTITDSGSRHSRGFVIIASARCDGSPYVVPNGERERVLQFTEAAALQGFPSDYVFVASQSRAWKMVAQAIQIDLGRAILKAICREAGLL